MGKDLILGVALIFLGFGFFGDALGAWPLEWFLQSWWVLFIMIPCIGDMRSRGISRGNLMGFALGIALLLSQWFPEFRPYAVSYILVAFGGIIVFVPVPEKTN